MIFNYSKLQEGNTCVAFNSSSRYLLIGGKGKTLNIWDMKTKSIKKTYKVGTTLKLVSYLPAFKVA